MANGSAEVSVEMVGNAFVSQYYNILHQSPELVHKFYQDTSTMSRPSIDGSLKTVTTMEGIKNLVASLACHEYRAEIMTADAQGSFKEGVIVLVTGCLTGKDDIRRKFSETFFLAPQDNGYYVHNDVFRFIAEKIPGVESQESIVPHGISTDTLAPAQEVTQETAKSLPENAVSVEVESNGIPEAEEVSIESADPKVSAVSQPPAEVVVDKKEEQPVAALGSELSEDAPKKSYASIVKVVKDGKDVSVRAPSKSTRTLSSANGQQPGSTKPSLAPNGSHASSGGQQAFQKVAHSVSEASAANDYNGNGSSTADEAEEKGFSVYIGNLPYNATVAQVENEFKRFGPIKRGGVQVRCNKGFCFGFVEYETSEAMQKAVQSSKIQIGGNDAFIEEKKTSTRVVNGVSLFSSGGGGGGRGGGYRNNNNGFRGGRGNFSGGGRGGGYGGRSDYGRRNGEYYHQNGDGGGYSRDRFNQNRGGGGKAYQQGGGK